MSDLIKIDGKELKPFGSLTTGASFLFDLGYVYHSTGRKGDMYSIKASPKDHYRLISNAEAAEVWANDSVKAVGDALSALKFDEIDSELMRDLGYLISGLGDLQKLIKHARNVIQESKDGHND